MSAETAGNLTAATKDGLPDHRRANHPAVENDNQTLADVVGGYLAEFPRAHGIELEVHDPPSRIGIISGLGVIKAVAADHDAFAHHEERLDAGRIARGYDHSANRGLVIFDHGRGFLVEKMQGEFRRAPEKIFDVFGVFYAGKLDQNAVGPLTLDGGFAGAGFINTAANDFNGL